MDERQRGRLEAFAALLVRWNSRINLVSPRDLPSLWQRHVLDSAQLVQDLPDRPTPITDLGSGAGFPGLILAICTHHPVTLIESDQRKASFLREAARHTGCLVTILNSRIEQASPPPAGIVTARALAPLTQLLEWSAPLLQPGGTCLFLKGRNAAAELTEARAKWHMAVAQRASATSSDGVILALSEIRRRETADPPKSAGRG